MIKWIVLGAIFLLMAFIGLCWFLGWYFSADGYKGNASAHFNGRQFQNLEPTPNKGFKDVLKWMANRQKTPWPKWVSFEKMPTPSAQADSLRVTFINHSTLLIQSQGLNVLTDPIWAKRASPLWFLGPKRVHAPGLTLAQLPPLDVILISHNHYDHMDIATLKWLSKHHPKAIFLTGLGNKAFLQKNGLKNVIEADWWQTTRVHQVPFTFVPAQHFSSRGFYDRNTTLWGGVVWPTPQGNVYFAGDSGWGTHFKSIGQKYGPIALACIPIGAYEPRSFMAPVHIDPAQAIQAHIDLQAKYSIGIHWGTFQLTDEGRLAPVDELNKAKAHLLNPESFFTLNPGEAKSL